VAGVKFWRSASHHDRGDRDDRERVVGTLG
jgi:hypothetical protein